MLYIFGSTTPQLYGKRSSASIKADRAGHLALEPVSREALDWVGYCCRLLEAKRGCASADVVNLFDAMSQLYGTAGKGREPSSEPVAEDLPVYRQFGGTQRMYPISYHPQWSEGHLITLEIFYGTQ